jgi:pimeloyl-ACP methyl ester carboxylesterase
MNTTARGRMLAGLSATTRVADVGGVSTAIIELGDGAPMLLLHGGIECGGAVWAPVLGRLAQRYRIVVPDAPGLGESGPVARLDLVARWASRGTDRISRLVVYGAPAVGPYRIPWRLRYVAVRFAIRPTPRNAERFDRFALLDLDATPRRDPGWYEAFDAYTRARAGEAHVKKTMRQLIMTQTKPIPDAELARIDVPATLLWGRHDRMVPLSVGEAAAARHGWPLHVIDAAAHAPHIEQPDTFVDTLVAIDQGE